MVSFICLMERLSMSQSDLLLDTHVVLWFVAGNERLGLNARKAIDVARKAGKIYVSCASLWEVGCLQAKKKIDVGDDLRTFWLDAMNLLSGKELVLGRPQIFKFFTLEGMHNDPSDRFIVATAVDNEYTLVTADTKILSWAQANPGRLSVLDCR